MASQEWVGGVWPNWLGLLWLTAIGQESQLPPRPPPEAPLECGLLCREEYIGLPACDPRRADVLFGPSTATYW